NETQKEIAGIQSATSRQNTKDQVYAQNEMLAYQQKESTARVASIMENTNLSKQQQVSEIMRQMLTQAQTAGQYFTNDQIDRKSGSAGMPRPISYAVFCLKKKVADHRCRGRQLVGQRGACCRVGTARHRRDRSRGR